MHFVPISSFDPLFWFHHNNVERMFVLWQMMNPDEWLEPSAVVQENTMSTIMGQVRGVLLAVNDSPGLLSATDLFQLFIRMHSDANFITNHTTDR
jgi:hypothetical protein